MFESVDGRTDGRTDARTSARVPSYKLKMEAMIIEFFSLTKKKKNNIIHVYDKSQRSDQVSSLHVRMTVEKATKRNRKTEIKKLKEKYCAHRGTRTHDPQISEVMSGLKVWCSTDWARRAHDIHERKIRAGSRGYI